MSPCNCIFSLHTDYRYRHDLLSDSSRGAGGNYTVTSAALNHTGVYVCTAERGKPANYITISNTQLIWVTGEFKLNHRMSDTLDIFLDVFRA
ncbi:hypothetical protein cypCar_00049461 [Cyprinus carpio]|nr:hypothetical protein cypCar_00049461 [Cyprinus carpio]